MSKPRSPLLPIFLIVVVDVLGLTIILPLLPFYAEKLGASPTMVGILVATYAACQLVSGPILGQISDRVGRKPVLLVSQVGTFIGFLILARAETLWMVFVSRFMDGVTAGNLSIAQAYISDVTAPENRAKAFGVIGVAFGLGFLVGPAFSGYLSQFGYHYPVYAAAALSATSILATAFLLPSASTVTPAPSSSQQASKDEPAPPAGRRLSVLDWGNYTRFFKQPELSSLLLQFFLFAFYFALFTTCFSLFAERRFTHDGVPFGPKEVGYVFAYSGFLGIILQGGLIGRLVKRFGEKPLIISGFLASTVAYLILGVAYVIPVLLISATIGAFGSGVLRPTLTSLITQQVHRHEQGVVLGLTQSMTSIAHIVAPMIGGLLIEHGMLSSWAVLIAGTALIALVRSLLPSRG